MNPKQDVRQTRYERAGWWLAHGVAVVPLKPQSKELQPGYGVHQAHITSLDFARQWFLTEVTLVNTDANLGVVLGESAGLVVADWDDRGHLGDARRYEAWRATIGAEVETLNESKE